MKTPTTAGSTSTKEMSANNNSQNEHNYERVLGMHPGQRPLNIENDVSSLGKTKRVSNILTSPYFKEELESVVTDLIRGGGNAIAKELANFFSPMGRGNHGSALLGLKTGIGCVSPINDLSGVDTSSYVKGEKSLRCKLAALYRIVDLYGWTQSIYNHITVRVSQEQEHFLINPFGLLYHEVSASKLVKVNMQGEVVAQGSTTLGMNAPGYTLHSAIHAARPDLHCVIHVHTSDVVAVSCMEHGLLPLSQEALIVGDVSYHNYQGMLFDAKEKKSIQKHLGPNNKVMFLRNHGLVACGGTVEEAFHYLYHVLLACSIQVKAMSCTRHDKLIQYDRSSMKSRMDNLEEKSNKGGSGIQWKRGEMMFEALVRMLDDMGYRSGYFYKNPMLLQPKQKVKNDVELPATAFGHTMVLPEEIESARGNLRHSERTRWVNSPNQYTRVVEHAEEGEMSAGSSQNGDVSPKTKTKWKKTREAGEGTGNVVRADPNQFVPTNTDPREVLATRKSIRGLGRWESNRPGPSSQLLHSVSPDKVASNQVTSSSKGIIEKGCEVTLVAPAGPPNPFNEVTQSDLKEYHRQVLGEEEEKKEEVEGKNEEVVVAPEEEPTSPTVKINGVESETTEQETPEPQQKVEIKQEEEKPKEEKVEKEEVKERSASNASSSEDKNSSSKELMKEKPKRKEENIKNVTDSKSKTPSKSASMSSEEVVLRSKKTPPSSPREQGWKKSDKKKKRSSLSFLKKKKGKD